MRTTGLLGLLCVLVGLPTAVTAQGLLLDERDNVAYRLPRVVFVPREPRQPRPPQSYRVQELALDVNLQDQIAKTQVSQTFVNTGSRPIEACFVFPLPQDGAVDSMTFMVDGKEHPARLLTADEARRIYESHVRRNRDPALVEWIGRGMFKTSVFPLPPGAERQVTLRYTQICRTQDGLTELQLPLSTGRYTDRAIASVRVQVTIQGSAPVKNVYSPSHAVRIERPNSNTARISYTAENVIPGSDFHLLFDAARGEIGTSLLSYRPDEDHDGYFLLLVSPEIKRAAADRVVRKNIIFVVDRSGSMSGKKIEQARGALRFVLNNLNEGDLFNIVVYDSQVESFRPELQRFNERTRTAALGFVEGIYAGGSTNIDGALDSALAQLQDEKRPSYVVFLTDGLPTAGERNELRIVENASQRNKVRARIFSFGVGYDVNSLLLDKLSRACFGQSLYVRPDEDIETNVSRLYNRIGAPVLTDLDVSFDMEGFGGRRGSPVNRVYPRNTYDLFAGEQLVLVGRYRNGGAARIRLTGRVGEEHRRFDFPATFATRSSDESHAFVEKLWALRRVGEIIDEIDLHGRNDELVDELITLAKRHGIVTPYTSFLADETQDVRDLAGLRGRAGTSLRLLEEQSGNRAFFQRELKAELQQAGSGGGGFGGVADRYSSAPAPSGQAGGRQALFDMMVGNAAARPDGQPTIMQVGRKTFLRRDGRWVDSTLTETQQKNVQRVERFSPEYFELVRTLGRDARRYLAIDGEVTVVIDGQAYAY